MNVNQARKNIDKKMKKIKQGHFYSINSKRVKGHKGQITKKNKNGKIEAVILTHAKYTRGVKNIPLENNPEIDRLEQSYIVREKEIVNKKQIGKHHENVVVKNKSDKSKIRYVAKKKKQKKME